MWPIIAEETKTAISAMKPKLIIMAGLDESFYAACYDKVHTLPATKDLAANYQIHGELVVAGKEAQKKLVAIMEPIWKATEGIRTVIVGPVVRYVTGGCCVDPDHMPNRYNDSFAEKIKADVADAKVMTGEHLRQSGHNHCRVIDMNMDMLGKKPEEIWGEDPTLPKDAIFDSLHGRCTTRGGGQN
jgi:hypothetical protein